MYFYFGADGSDKSTIIFVSEDARTFCTNLTGSTRQQERQVCAFKVIFHETLMSYFSTDAFLMWSTSLM